MTMAIVLVAALLIPLVEHNVLVESAESVVNVGDDVSWKSSFSVASNQMDSEILRSFSFERYSVNEAGVLSIPMSAEERHQYLPVEAGMRDESSAQGMSLLSSSSQIIGCASLVFSVPVSIGSSRSTFNLIVDTGSTTMAVASSRCTGCHVSPLWSPSSSTQQQYTAGPVTSIYASNTGWSGQAYRDTVSIGSASASLVFASIDSTQGSFFQSAGCDGSSTGNTNQGIMGFAYSRLALPPTQGFFQQWQSQTNGANIFTIQMCQRSGNLWIGGYDNQYKGKFRWTPIVDTIWYSVHINSVSVNGQTLPLSSAQLNPGDSAVDSGTTMTILPSALYTSIVNSISSNSAFVSAFGSSFLTAGYCSKPRNGHSIAQLNGELPRITYTFGGVNGDTPLSLTLNPISSYLYVIQTSGNSWLVCPGLVNGGNNGAVFGYTFMNQFIVAFDVGMNRLGFAPCDNCNGYDGNGIPYGSPPGVVTGGITSDIDSYNTPTPPLRPATDTTQTPPTQRASTHAPTTITPTCSVAVWWQTSTFGSCSKSCGGGTRTRSVTCLNMAMMTVSDSLCACSNAKPSTIESCNTNLCELSPMYVSSVLLNSSSSPLSAPLNGNVEISFSMSNPDTSTHADTVMIWIQTNASSLPSYISRSISVSYLKDASGMNVAQGSYLWTIDSSLAAGPYQVAVGVSSMSYQVTSTLTIYDPCANACDVADSCQNQYGEPVCIPVPATSIPPTQPATVSPSTEPPAASATTIATSAPVPDASTTNTNTSDISITVTPTNITYCLNGGSLNESTTSSCVCASEYTGDICEMLSTPVKFYFYYSYSSMEGQEGQLITLIQADISYSLNISTNHIHINSISNGTYTIVDVSLSCDTRDSSCTTDLLNIWISQIGVLVNDTHSRLYMGLAGHRVAKVDIPTQVIQGTPSSSHRASTAPSVPVWAISTITSVAVVASVMVSAYMYYRYTRPNGKKQMVQPVPYIPKADNNSEEEAEASDKLSELKLGRMIDLNRPKRLERSTSSSGIAMLKRGVGGVCEATDPVSPYVESNVPASPYVDEFSRNIMEHVVHIN